MAKNPANRLDTARAKHAQIAAQIAEKQAARNTALLAGQEAGGIAKIDAELATLQHAARTEADRITLFEAEARREAEAAAVKRKASHINRFSKTLSDADALAVQVQDEILPALLAKVRKIAELRERARAGFAVRSSHANTAAASIEGAALSAHAVMAHLAYGFYRTSAQPFLGGRPGERVQPSLLGALCPRLELKLTPDKITPLATALRAASAFAVAKENCRRSGWGP